MYIKKSDLTVTLAVAQQLSARGRNPGRGERPASSCPPNTQDRSPACPVGDKAGGAWCVVVDGGWRVWCRIRRECEIGPLKRQDKHFKYSLEYEGKGRAYIAIYGASYLEEPVVLDVAALFDGRHDGGVVGLRPAPRWQETGRA